MRMHRNLFLAVTLAAVASTAALDQTRAPVVGSARNGTQSVAAGPTFFDASHRDAGAPHADDF